jgi:hypothetical protein
VRSECPTEYPSILMMHLKDRRIYCGSAGKLSEGMSRLFAHANKMSGFGIPPPLSAWTSGIAACVKGRRIGLGFSSNGVPVDMLTSEPFQASARGRGFERSGKVSGLFDTNRL